MVLVKRASAAQVAVSVQVPVPLIMVTRAVVLPVLATVQTPAVPVTVMVGTAVELVVAVTVKVDRYDALAGAPVKVTVGAASVASVV